MVDSQNTMKKSLLYKEHKYTIINSKKNSLKHIINIVKSIMFCFLYLNSGKVIYPVL